MRRIIDHEMEVSETVGTGKRPTPSAAIRAYCRLCLGLQQWRRAEVEDCQGGQSDVGPCPLFLYRLGKRRPPVRIFRAMCLQCMGGARGAVTECATEDCPCHPYRFGRNPALVGKRGASADRMAAIRAARCPVIQKFAAYFERSATGTIQPTGAGLGRREPMQKGAGEMLTVGNKTPGPNRLRDLKGQTP